MGSSRGYVTSYGSGSRPKTASIPKKVEENFRVVLDRVKNGSNSSSLFDDFETVSQRNLTDTNKVLNKAIKQNKSYIREMQDDSYGHDNRQMLDLISTQKALKRMKRSLNLDVKRYGSKSTKAKFDTYPKKKKTK